MRDRAAKTIFGIKNRFPDSGQNSTHENPRFAPSPTPPCVPKFARRFRQRRWTPAFFAVFAAAFTPPYDAPAAEPLPVIIRVDAAKNLGPSNPIWRFFGADEPNYAYLQHARKLLGELGALAHGENGEPHRGIFFRAHNLLTSGDGTPVAFMSTQMAPDAMQSSTISAPTSCAASDSARM